MIIYPAPRLASPSNDHQGHTVDPASARTKVIKAARHKHPRAILFFPLFVVSASRVFTLDVLSVIQR